MSALSKVILAKMALTVAWFVPLLFFPIPWLEHFCGPPQLSDGAVFLRLLGMAFAALLVGYGFGYLETLRGHYPRGVVWTGIVSNGGAYLVLFINRGNWVPWNPWAAGIMWGSLVATGLIAALLIFFGPWQRRSTDA